MVDEAALKKAINDLDSQEALNYAITATKYKINRRTLMRRYKGLSRLIQEAHSESQTLLTPTQEAIIVEHINTLLSRGLPPTTQFIRNLVFKAVKIRPGKNWVYYFYNRHKNQLKSIYLRAID
jgi:hypothetical protein